MSIRLIAVGKDSMNRSVVVGGAKQIKFITPELK